MKVIIPSKDRLDYTAGKFFDEYTLVLEPQDYDKYEHDKKIKLKDNDKGFGYLMKSIADYVLEEGEKYFLFVDDDIFNITCRDGEYKQQEMIQEALGIMEKNKLSQLWVSFKGHNWYEEKELKIGAGAVWGMHFSNAEHIEAVGNYLEVLKIFSDYEITARLVKRGFRIGRWYKYMFHHKMKSQEGGASFIYEKKNLMMEQCQLLKRLYGDTVRVFINDKHGGLPEVRFNWRKLSNG